MGDLRAGLAAVVITPPVGVRLAGYSARSGASVGVLDELYARALVLESGRDRVVIVACDVLELNAPLCAAIRAGASVAAQVDPRNIMVSAIHTHCGPDLDLLGDAEIDMLIAKASGAVRAAVHSLQPAEIGFGTARCRAGANRRHPRSPMGPYFLYNDTDGMMDETVAVTFLRRADHSVLGGMVNYACHPVALGDDELHMSRDFVHFTLETLESAWGPGAVPLFLQGCAGNINPRWIYDDASRDPPPDRVLPVELAPRLAETARIGRILGGAALAASQSILTFSGTATLAGVSRTIELPLREDLPAGMIGTPGHAAAAAPAVRTRYLGMGQTMSAGMKSVTTEVQVLRVGESLVIGLPGEIFVEWQVRIRERLGARHVSVVELANDSVSYIPTPEAFTEGGYEPLVSFFAPEAGAIVVSAAVEAAESLLEG